MDSVHVPNHRISYMCYMSYTDGRGNRYFCNTFSFYFFLYIPFFCSPHKPLAFSFVIQHTTGYGTWVIFHFFTTIISIPLPTDISSVFGFAMRVSNIYHMHIFRRVLPKPRVSAHTNDMYFSIKSNVRQTWINVKCWELRKVTKVLIIET